jgi:molybdate transport system ATP-binding protein
MDLPLLSGEEAGTVIKGTIEAYDDEYDLTQLKFSGGELRVPGQNGRIGDELRLRIRANDISLCRDRPERSTILNILPATIEEIQEQSGPMLLLRLRLGSDRVISRITRRSRDNLALQVGDEILAQIKSVAIRKSTGS